MQIQPNRVEQVQFKINLTKKNFEQFKEQVQSMGFSSTINLGNDDTVLITYEFLIQYFNNINRNFQTIIDMIAAGIVINADIKETNHGICLIEQVLDKLKTIMRKI